ncbi:MAG: hypothetical protein LQ351_004445 [Letrouitia transgressa]|nr:MAG: hypothetical protein LQ351_004445 [Letrouitia transgressa]
MPLEPDDQQRIDDAKREFGADGSGTKILVLNASEAQKLGPFTVACIIMNRTIGVVGMSALFVWLEFGLSIPKFELLNRAEDGTPLGGESMQCVTRNGGEKNYLEYIFKSKKMRTTCVFGIMYIVLGNLTGNAIVFGIYVLQAADVENRDPLVRGLAVICLSTACLIHAIWRKGGIMANNILAVLKFMILLSIIVIGFAASAGASFGHGPVHGQTVDPKTLKSTSNFDTHSSFAFARGDVGGYASSILYVVYSFSGYKQPFYVLSEVYRPKKYFAITSIATQAAVVTLFILVNIAYLCAVSFDKRLDDDLDMATVFFREVFGNELAPLKQEIAKEGIFPDSVSKFFASNTTTPWIRLKNHLSPPLDPHYQPEQSPMAALLLHWIFCMILIASTSPLIPSVAFTILAPLYSYTVVFLVALFTSSGLLYLRYFSPEKETWRATAGFNFLGPVPAVVYTVISAFILIGLWIPPKAGSLFTKDKTGVEWYVVPTIGLGMLFAGLLYYWAFKYAYPRYFKQNSIRVVEREAVIVYESGEYVQALEIVEPGWELRHPPANDWGGGWDQWAERDVQIVTVAGKQE